MPDIPYKVPGTGETRYRHITSGQQRLMSKLNWEQTIRRQRAAKFEDSSKDVDDQDEPKAPEGKHYHGDNLYDDNGCWVCDDIALAND